MVLYFPLRFLYGVKLSAAVSLCCYTFRCGFCMVKISPCLQQFERTRKQLTKVLTSLDRGSVIKMKESELLRADIKKLDESAKLQELQRSDLLAEVDVLESQKKELKRQVAETEYYKEQADAYYEYIESLEEREKQLLIQKEQLQNTADYWRLKYDALVTTRKALT